MSRQSPDIDLVEMPGVIYPDLRTAQKNAIKSLASFLDEILRDLLARGWLVTIDGQIIPNPERKL